MKSLDVRKFFCGARKVDECVNAIWIDIECPVFRGAKHFNRKTRCAQPSSEGARAGYRRANQAHPQIGLFNWLLLQLFFLPVENECAHWAPEGLRAIAQARCSRGKERLTRKTK